MAMRATVGASAVLLLAGSGVDAIGLFHNKHELGTVRVLSHTTTAADDVAMKVRSPGNRAALIEQIMALHDIRMHNTTGDNTTEEYHNTTDGVRGFINDLLLDSETRLDTETSDCAASEEMFKNSVKDTKEAQDKFAAAATLAETRAEVARASIDQLESETSLMEEKLKANEDECAHTKAKQQAQLETIEHDLGVVKRVLEMHATECDDDTNSTALVQRDSAYVAECRMVPQLKNAWSMMGLPGSASPLTSHKQYGFMQVTTKSGRVHSSFRELTHSLKSAAGHHAVQRSFRQMYLQTGAKLSKTHSVGALAEKVTPATNPRPHMDFIQINGKLVARRAQVTRHHHHKHHHGKRSQDVNFAANETSQNFSTSTFTSTPDSTFGQEFNISAANHVPVEEGGLPNVNEEGEVEDTAPCSLAGSAACEQLNMEMGNMVSEIQDSRDELEGEMNRLEKQCRGDTLHFESELETLSTQTSNAMGEESGAAADHQESQSASSMKAEELIVLKEEQAAELKRCEDTLSQLDAELCSFRSMRSELLQLSNVKNGTAGDSSSNVQMLADPPLDCVMAKWEAEGTCSKECMGANDIESGKELHRRSILQGGNQWGTPCGELEKHVSCNQFACPVHCEMSEWSGLSTCTAGCGGGVQKRSRTILQASEHHGNPCGTTQESVPCNVQSCDEPCELSPPTEWTGCTVACGGGVKERHQTLLKEGTGSLMCPPKDMLIEYEECNTQACPEPALVAMPDGTMLARLECKSKVDIVFMLSGGATSGTADWTGWKEGSMPTQIEAMRRLLMVVPLDAEGLRVGIILNGGFHDWSMGTNCEATGDPDMCGIYTIHPLTADVESLEASLDKLGSEWNVLPNFGGMMGPPQPAPALVAGDSMLMNGAREGANTVLVYFHDKWEPVFHPGPVEDAANLAKQHSRVILIEAMHNEVINVGMNGDIIEHIPSAPVNGNTIIAQSWADIANHVPEILPNLCPNIAAPTEELN